ncbi:LexA family transcriptional regulator [Photobacterium nomapromontoriensis]|uniref:LexA family transcriptional regulator n=1 Tax=Photobacterium nomapromontoriensis TaxID=2910237 RepID=UPI003D14E099
MDNKKNENGSSSGNRIADPIQNNEIGSLPDRLKELIGVQSVRSFALEMGVSETAIRKYLKAETAPSLDISLRICKTCDVKLEWFVTGYGPKAPYRSDNEQPDFITACPSDKPDFEEEFVMVPGYHIQVSMGNGCNAFDEEPKRYLAFRRKYLKYRRLNPKQLAVVFARGDSMVDTIKDNDSLLVNLDSTTPIDGLIFVVRMGDELYAKRIQKSFDGSIRLISDNKEYSPIEVPVEQLDQLCIIGQVVQRSTDL